MNRRRFLKTLGGSGLVLAATAGGLTQCDQMPEEAIQAWQGPQNSLTDREWILSYALLAPNPHNMQSWIADLREENVITLHADDKRLLPETDPFARQITIGQGTFLELLDIAAKERGYRANITLYPEGAPSEKSLDIQGKPIARVLLQPDKAVQKDPLFSSILNRRSTKDGYAETPLSVAHHEALKNEPLLAGQQTGFALTADEVKPFRDFAREAMLTEIETPRTYIESIERTRIGADEIKKYRDGVDLHGPLFWWLKALGQMTMEKAMTPGTGAYQGGIDYALGWAKGTHGMGWLITDDNSRVAQVQAGRSYVRLNLLATQLGVAMHPVSQILQEYPEMQNLQRQFNQHLGIRATQKVQMFFRLGYQDSPGPSPRRNLADIVRV